MLYHSIIPTRKTYEKEPLHVHQKMSNVTQNIHDFWPHAMDVTKDRKANYNIKSSFMHNLLHIVILFIVCKCLLMLLLIKCSNKSLPLVI